MNRSLRLTSHAPTRLATVAPVALLLALGATSAFAGTTGTEFQTMYTTMLNWATGYLGKAIAVADSGARGRGLRALHGLRADHHRLDHDRHDLTVWLS